MKSVGRQWTRLLFVLLFVVALGSPFNAFAQDEEKDTYAGLDLNVALLDVEGATFMPINLRAKLGLVMLPDLIPVLGFESHFGFNVTDDTSTINGNDATLWIGNYIGMYARVSHEIEDVVNFYGLLGLATAQLKGDTRYIDHDTQSSLSFGAGAGIALPFGLEGNLELMQLVGGKNYNVYMFSFGVSYEM